MPESWALMLPTNHFVTSMLDKRSIQKAEKNISARNKLLKSQEILSGGTPFEVCEVQHCEVHPEKIVEFYCSDHSQPYCTSCATLSHLKFENVTSIQKVAFGIKQSTKESSLSQKIREHVIQLDEIIDDRNKNLADVENSTEEINTRVADIKTEILKHIDRIEETIIVEVTSTKKQVGIKLKDK
ncbi:unnamed protein product [Mytilus coruscus]|uniref:B box-type domain-containing protein n=1 Tax=Mytilus coruscus TaxID=42192 RepID=A0A6J8CHB8_MYTCO|nr:unnamed protein product [Mytilus coruscus]